MDEDYKQFEAKTVDEAIVSAMKTFRASFENLDIKIISEGSKGLFGLVGTKSAKILARPLTEDSKPTVDIETPAVEQAEPEQEDHKASTDDAIMNLAREILSDMLRLMHLSAEINLRGDNTLEIMGDGSGILIGKRGQTLDSLQFLLNRIINKSRQENVYITLDTEGYRQRHLSHLKSLAIKMGEKVKRTGKSVSLDRMNPYDRRIIHITLKNDNDVNTKSIGDGQYKKIVIIPRKASK